jgi:hypothetical protein
MIGRYVTRAVWNIDNSFLSQNKKDWVRKKFDKNSLYKLVGLSQLMKREIEKRMKESGDLSDENRELQCLQMISQYVDKDGRKPFYVALMFIALGDPYTSIYKNFLNQVLTNNKSAWDQLFITIKDLDYTLVCT